MGESLADISKENWRLAGFIAESSSQSLRRNTTGMIDSRKPWPIMNVRKTDSSDCDYKYWVWRPFQPLPRCGKRRGLPCVEDECPQRI